MYSGVLSPQRGLPRSTAYASKTAAIASPVRHPGPKARCDRVGRDAPFGEGRQPAQVVDERRRLDRPAVPARELRDEVRLVRHRERRVAIQHHAEQRRPRAADAEHDHGGVSRRHPGSLGTVRCFTK